MLPSIGFNDQESLQTDKIYDVRCDDMLPTEFEFGHSAIAEHGPQSLLGWSGIGAHFASAFTQFAGTSALVI